MLHGIYNSYYDNKQLMISSNYCDGKRMGEMKKYNRRGRLTSSKIYVDDVLQRA
jgi:antitoxin component YwqK of YwqJK toxin-antitoxin module